MRMTNEEIKKIKTDFVRAIMPDRTFKSKAEIKERLIKYRSLFAIRDKNERLFVNQMITIASNIPDDLIEKKKEEIKEIYECPYFCPSCEKRMFDLKTFPRTTYGRNILSHTKTKTKEVTVVEWKHISMPKEYQVICLNHSCPRYAKNIDVELLNITK